MKNFINYIIDSIREFWAPRKECSDCGKTFYPCQSCGCAYDDAGAAVRCAEWDTILKHQCQGHHHHDDPAEYPLSSEEQWLEEHRHEQSMYAGKMVAVKAEGIVASGYNFNEVCAQLKEKGIPVSNTLFARIEEHYVEDE